MSIFTLLHRVVVIPTTIDAQETCFIELCPRSKIRQLMMTRKSKSNVKSFQEENDSLKNEIEYRLYRSKLSASRVC